MTTAASPPHAPAQAQLRRLLAARGLRALADGCVAVLLPAYLLALGHEAWAVGVIATAPLRPRRLRKSSRAPPGARARSAGRRRHLGPELRRGQLAGA